MRDKSRPNRYLEIAFCLAWSHTTWSSRNKEYWWETSGAYTSQSFYNQNTHHCIWGTVILLLRKENGDQELFKWWYTDVLKQSPLCKVRNTGKLRFFNMVTLVSKQLALGTMWSKASIGINLSWIKSYRINIYLF